MSDEGLSHIDEAGRARMVDVGAKAETVRVARAAARVRMRRATLELIRQDRLAKGDVLATARIAGINAVKQTAALIPLCHPLRISQASVDFDEEEGPGEDEASILITATARAVDRTGVEMEAMCAAAVAGLTVYDMAKAVDRWMVLDQVRLLSKSGGKSGDLRRPTDTGP